MVLLMDSWHYAPYTNLFVALVNAQNAFDINCVLVPCTLFRYQRANLNLSEDDRAVCAMVMLRCRAVLQEADRAGSKPQLCISHEFSHE